MQQISLSLKKNQKNPPKQHIEVIYGFDSKPQICNIAIKELAADYCCEETVKNWENPTRLNSVAAVRDRNHGVVNTLIHACMVDPFSSQHRNISFHHYFFIFRYVHHACKVLSKQNNTQILGIDVPNSLISVVKETSQIRVLIRRPDGVFDKQPTTLLSTS